MGETITPAKVMEQHDKFNHNIVPRLQDIATVVLVTTVYKQNDIFEILTQLKNNEKELILQTERRLSHKLLLLPLPNSLMEKVLEVGKFVSMESNRKFGLIKDCDETCRCGFQFSIPLECFDCISFKKDATVDKLKSFTLMHERNYTNNYQIFSAASHFCSQTLVARSWEKLDFQLPGLEVREIYNRFLETFGSKDCALVKYWVYFINNRLNDFSIEDFDEEEEFEYEDEYSVNQEMFEYSLVDFNLSALKYFLKILTDGEKEYYMKRYIDQAFTATTYCSEGFLREMAVECLDVALFLLSQLSDGKKQIELLKTYIPRVMIPFVLNLLYRKFFEPIMQLIWPLIDSNDFNRILRAIFRMISETNPKSEQVFKVLWSQSSKCAQKLFMDFLIEKGARSTSFGFDLFSGVDYFDILKFLMSDCTEDERKSCLEKSLPSLKLEDSIKNDINYLDVLDNFLRDFFASEGTIYLFKKRVVSTYNFCLIPHWIKLDDYDSINKFYNWGFPSEPEILQFKRNFQFIRDVVRNLIISSDSDSDSDCDDDDYEEVEKFLKWCLNSRAEIKRFKKAYARL